MYKFKLFVVLITFAIVFSLVGASEKASLGDSNVAFHVIMEQPAELYKKISKKFAQINDKWKSNFETETASFKPILEGSKCAHLLGYAVGSSKEDYFFYLDVKDDAIFDNPLFATLPAKQKVGHVLVGVFKSENLPKAVALTEKVLAIKGSKDIEVISNFDNMYKSLAELLKEDDDAEELMMSLYYNIMEQLSSGNLTLNIDDAGVHLDYTLSSKAESLVSKIFKQAPASEAIKLLSYMSDGKGYAQTAFKFDLNAAMELIAESCRKISKLEDLDEDEKKAIGDFQKALSDIGQIGTVEVALAKNVVVSEKDGEQRLGSKKQMVVKVENANKTLQSLLKQSELLQDEAAADVIELLLSQYGIIGMLFEDFFEDFLDEVESFTVKEMSFDQMKAYKLGGNEGEGFSGGHAYCAAEGDYIYIASTTDSLKELMKNVKTKTVTNKEALESFQHFKEGSFFYSDYSPIAFLSTFDDLNEAEVIKKIKENLKFMPFKIRALANGQMKISVVVDNKALKEYTQLVYDDDDEDDD